MPSAGPALGPVLRSALPRNRPCYSIRDLRAREERMDKNTLTQTWDHLRQVVGTTLRTVAAIPADKLDSIPIPKMRSPKELAIHTFRTIREIPEGVARGRVTMLESEDPG